MAALEEVFLVLLENLVYAIILGPFLAVWLGLDSVELWLTVLEVLPPKEVP